MNARYIPSEPGGKHDSQRESMEPLARTERERKRVSVTRTESGSRCRSGHEFSAVPSSTAVSLSTEDTGSQVRCFGQQLPIKDVGDETILVLAGIGRIRSVLDEAVGLEVPERGANRTDVPLCLLGDRLL